MGNGSRRRRTPGHGVDGARTATRLKVGGLVVGLVLAVAAPAFGHASFGAAASFGFSPNTAGGTGAVGSTPPYGANTTPTLYLRVPFEQTDLFNGSDDTTVDVKAIIPAGWTNATCGAAKTNKNDATTNNTNQPNAVVGTWTCAVETAAGHTVLHWTGPQVVAPATALDSAQWFQFTVTTPSPAVQTTYNGINGTEGFIVEQTYASGELVRWIPDAAVTGGGVVAGGLARTVAAGAPVTTTTTTSTTTTTLPPGPTQQSITATVNLGAGEFAMTIDGDRAVVLSDAVNAGTYLHSTGEIDPIIVSDTRSGGPTWSVSGQVGDFTGGVSGKYLGWTPKIVSAGAGAVAGPPVPSGITSGNGLKDASVLASATAGHPTGSGTLGADLDLRLPTDTPNGTYTTTLTVTALT